jgi:hypothetical protein
MVEPVADTVKLLTPSALLVLIYILHNWASSLWGVDPVWQTNL